MNDPRRASARCLLLSLSILGLLLTAARLAEAATVTLGSSMDATIFQAGSPSFGGNLGGGGNPGLFAGTNSTPFDRRAMVGFDVSQIPTNATISSVQLRLVIGQIAGSGGGSGSGGQASADIDLHKMSTAWTEGTTGPINHNTLAGAGGGVAVPAGQHDATWLDSRYDPSAPTTWTDGVGGGKPGTDWVSAASTALHITEAQDAAVTWLSTSTLVSDVTSWVQHPATNFGWMLINEDETSMQTFRAFYSKEYTPNSALTGQALADFLFSQRPQLIVTYSVPEPSTMILLALAFGGLLPWVRRKHAVKA